MNTITLGKLGEQLARMYLLGHGYEILAHNYRLRGGEIDIICRHQQVVVFVEVKTRRKLTYGLGRESITPRKQDRLRAAAQNFLAAYADPYHTVRFDVIDIVWPNNQSPRLTHLQNCVQSDS
ncbi:MAG: hypothetical protein UY81_C0082G0004 [Candidatus Giovannonibacteria bacterium GW2011_GWA2_53_7]|uniref:UPF0102 protein UY81_C0082G0004 n=1 Tax=Candidatus Giovannonibacteria bacterium GW2011_GWA2_53_7 TaxID=1618650 RepID=A0A0G1XSQ0_9BACT|nr:MAG: hypothetical protein UY81_C0082G0004 [Candidatus Giovannonibacteria bacterium GW2011_GWA2_53_7]